MKHFGDIAFTEAVKAEQTARGSREPYAKMTAGPAPDSLGENEAAFIAARDSFYMASVNSDGWPYVQHRGGPRGFLKVLGPTTIGFADYRGNRQYVSVGNIKEDKRVSLFLMDYPNKARLKILGHATVQETADVPELAAQLAVYGEGRVERVFTIEVDAFDWNCTQFITPRYTTDELAESLAPMIEELEHLRAEVKRLSANL